MSFSNIVWLLYTWVLFMFVANSLSIPRSHSTPAHKPLSEQEHYADDGKTEHNPEYDHEAFLGKDEAKHFDELSPEESQEQLGMIYDKVDADENGFVTKKELRTWMENIQNHNHLEELQSKWEEMKPKNEEAVELLEHFQATYGQTDIDAVSGPESDDIKEMMRKDEKKWHVADDNKDGLLSVEEYHCFLHPEICQHTRVILYEESFEEIDKDKDGKISMDEFLADIGDNEENSEDKDSKDNKEWLETEKKEFQEELDANKDGFLSKDEALSWLAKNDEWDSLEEETDHLFLEADQDSNELLTKEEVLEKFDLFAGSQATDYGEMFGRHDEF